MKIISKSIILTTLSIICSCGLKSTGTDSPYPPSPVIKSITFDFNNLIQLAPGSDLWPVTWAADNKLYTSWGDGGGFGGTNKDGRVSLGFAKIEGLPPEIKGKNIWGGKSAVNVAEFHGKCSGIVSVDGILYAWINLQNNKIPDKQLVWSKDFGKNWNKSSLLFPGGGPFIPTTFLNFGKDYDGSRDDFVYIYGNDRRGKYRSLFLMRVHRQKLKDRDAYEFFDAVDANNKPTWVSDINRRGPVAIDADGISATALIYHPQIKRYLLTTHHRNYVGRFGIFDAPEPWGPWTTVAYYNNWGGLGKVEGGMPHSFPTKWISADGNTMWMVFSGTGKYDSFNLIRVRLEFDNGIQNEAK